MPKNINAAYRVHSVLERAASQQINLSAVEVWALTFSVSGKNSAKRNTAVVRMIALLHDQIEEAHSKMKASDFSPELYEPAFEQARRATSVESLNQQWQGYKNSLDAATLKAIAFCSEVLPTEEVLLDQTKLDNLLKELQALKQSLEKSGLPDEVKQFILEQIEIIENALREYPVTGSKVFTEALIRAATNAAQNPDVAARSADTEQFQTLRKIWSFLKETNANVDTAVKALTVGTAIAAIAGKIVGSN